MSVKHAEIILALVRKVTVIFALTVMLNLAVVMIIFKCLKNYILNLKDRLLKKA